MSGFTTTVRNTNLDNTAAMGSWISLHTADGGNTGASECIGGSYARVQTTWGASSAPNKTGSGVTLNPSGTATYWGIWSAATAGTFIGSFPLSSSQSSQFVFIPSLTD